MSNRLPGQPHPDGGDRLLIVYADGYHTAMSKHDVADKISGDDFCEPLPLLAPQADAATLHAQLTDGVAAGLDLFGQHNQAGSLTE
jgi:predicted signal transduction protein with EAL and GGDEF domain